MHNDNDDSNPSDDAIVTAARIAALGPDGAIVQAIANMKDGEVFLFGSTFHEHRVIQCNELHLMFCYHDEIHMAKRDYGQDAYNLLCDIYRNGELYNIDTETMDRMKAVVDPVLDDEGKALLNKARDLLDENNLPVDPTDTDWMTDENIRNLAAPEVQIIRARDAAPTKSVSTFDSTQGEILVLSRFPINDDGDYAIHAVCSPQKLLTYIERPTGGTIHTDAASDYLVEAFDRGFASEFNIDMATFAWRLPSGDVVHQHST